MPVTMPATDRSKEAIEKEMGKMKPGLRHLLVTRCKLELEWVAELAAEGYTAEELLVPLGSNRDEMIDSLKILFELDWDHKNGRKVGMKLMTAVTACREKCASDAKRASEAAAQCVSLPLDGDEAKEAFDRVNKRYPGMQVAKTEYPTNHYMGVLEEKAKKADWMAEPLKEVVSKGEKENLNRQLLPSGDLNVMTMGISTTTAAPAHEGALRKKYKTMGLGWLGLAELHQEIPSLQGLYLETYTSFSSYVLGPKVAGLLRGKNSKDKWQWLLDTEHEVRNSWFEMVEATGCTLNKAILDSIGANPTKQRSGIWQDFANKVLEAEQNRSSGSGPQPNKRGAEGSWQWGREKEGKGAHKGEGKARGKDAHKGEGKGKGKAFVTEMWKGKLLVCPKHQKKICFSAAYKNGCRKTECNFCHECCPEPGCNIKVGPTHGLWSH